MQPGCTGGHDTVEDPLVPLVAGNAAGGTVFNGSRVPHCAALPQMAGQTGQSRMDAPLNDAVADRAVLTTLRRCGGQAEA
jgi:hypothetical protein